MENLELRYERSPSMVFRKVAEEFILVPIRNNAGDLDSIYTLNPVGARVWELLDGKRSVRDIVEALVEEFEVEKEEAEADVVHFLRQLEQIGAVKVCKS
ncbi:MAG: PqqD family protein [Candidatus Hydrothermarchaeota archaeon]|nr:MAG: PqqD family protein [Candidatus Hydrothermarchaeota archaeon]